MSDRGKVQLFIARFDGNQAAPKSDWVSIPGTGADVEWSADGSLLYFLSARDGFTCIWGQRVDPLTKKSVGSPFAVYHAHSSRRSLSNVSGFDEHISVNRNRLAFVLGEQTGNIWMARWQNRR